IDVNPFTAPVPETGLEPALPLRQPGPQPNVSSLAACCERIVFTLQRSIVKGDKAQLPFVRIVLVLGLDCQPGSQMVPKMIEAITERAVHTGQSEDTPARLRSA